MLHGSINLPKVIGHRGACAYAPENTLASMRKAAELGVSWVEFDVMLSADGEALIIHDEMLDRTTNGQGAVAELSCKALQQLDAGSWFSTDFAFEKIPTFLQLIQCLEQNNLAANVEIKPSAGQDHQTAAKTIEILQQHWPEHLPPPLVSSFSMAAMRTARELDGQLNLGFLLEEWQQDWRDLADELQCVAVHLDHELLTTKRAQEIKAAGYYLLAYTVDDKTRADECFAMGVDSVFSNCPDKVISS